MQEGTKYNEGPVNMKSVRKHIIKNQGNFVVHFQVYGSHIKVSISNTMSDGPYLFTKVIKYIYFKVHII